MVLEMHQGSMAMEVMGSTTVISLKEHSVEVPRPLSLYPQSNTTLSPPSEKFPCAAEGS